MEELVCAVDRNGIIQYISPIFMKVSGADECFQGRHLSILVHPKDYTDIKKMSAQAFENNTGFETMARIIRANGDWIRTSIKVLPLLNENGELQIILIYTDTNEIIGKQEAERQRETDIYNNVNLILWTYEISSGKFSVSGNCMGISGYSKEEIEQNPGNWYKYVHPEDVNIINEIYKKVLYNETTIQECRIIRPDGKVKWFSVKVTPILNQAGNISRIDGISIDITDKKEQAAQTEFSRRSKRKKELILFIDGNGIITDVPGLSKDNMDKSYLHLLNRPIFSFFSGKQAKRINTYFAEAKTGKAQSVTTTFKTENSIISWLKIKALPFISAENDVTILCVIEYNNLLLETKRRLLKNEKTIKELMKNRDIGIWHFNLEANLVITSPGIERISGYSAKDYAHDPFLWRKNIHPDDLEKLKDTNKTVFSGIIIKHKYRIMTKDRQVKWIHERIIPTLNEKGDVIFLEGLVTEITPKKGMHIPNAIKPITFSGNQNKLGMATLDLNGKFTSLNQTAQEISGYSEKELLSMTYLDLVPDQEKERAHHLFIDTIYGGEMQNHHLKVIHKGGRTIQLNIVGVPIYNGEDVNGMYIMINDLSYQLQLEKKLMETKQTFYEMYDKIELAIFLSKPDLEEGLGTILEANQYACKMLGYRYEELVNMPFKKIIHTSHFGMKSIFALNKKFTNIRTVFTSKPGEKQPVSLYSHLTSWDRNEIILSIAQAIHDEKGKRKKDPIEPYDSGRHLRVLMAEMNINTSELAQMTNLTTATISNLRTGKVKKPNIGTASKIAEALGVKISYIWPDLLY